MNFPTGSERFCIAGPAGQLELATLMPKEVKTDAVAVLCHPHPLHGGTMDNKVVVTLERVFRDLGLPVLRFNYRGVGKSEGSFGNYEGEIQDLKAVLAWLAQAMPGKEICLAGFSFGCYVAARVAAEQATKLLVTVAPAVEHAPYAELDRLPRPWIAAIPMADEVVSAEAGLAFAKAQQPPVDILTFDGTSHFFHGQLVNLREQLLSQIRPLFGQ